MKGRRISAQRFSKLRDFLKTFLLLKLILNLGNFHIMKVTSLNHILLPGAPSKTGYFITGKLSESFQLRKGLFFEKLGIAEKTLLSEGLQNLVGFTIVIEAFQKSM